MGRLCKDQWEEVLSFLRAPDTKLRETVCEQFELTGMSYLMLVKFEIHDFTFSMSTNKALGHSLFQTVSSIRPCAKCSR